MPVLRRREERPKWDRSVVAELFEKKLGKYEPPVCRLDALNWINALMCRNAACKIGRMTGYKDQWLIGAWYDEKFQKINMKFCQGRNVGRITSNGGYEVSFSVADCETFDDIDFKFQILTWNREDTRSMMRDLAARLHSAIESKDKETLRSLVRRFFWLDWELSPGKGCTMSTEQEIEVLKEKVEIALKNGATPSLKVAEELRAISPECGKWLDDTYLKYKRPEMVGDDKDGLCALLKSEGYLRKAMEKCKPEEVVYWFRIVKGIDPLPDSVRETAIKDFGENP